MKRNHMLVILLSAIWSTHFLLANHLNKIINPFVTGFVIRFGTLVILTALALGGGRFQGLFQTGRAKWKLVCVGALGFLLDATSFIGFRYSNADSGTVLLKTDILMANLIAILVYKQRFRIRDWFFTATVLLGVFLVMEVNPASLQFKIYDVFFILSALFVTLNAFLIQHIQRTHNTPNHVIAYYNNFYTLILFTIVMVTTGYSRELANVAGNRPLFLFSTAAACTQTLIYIVYYRCLASLPVYLVKILLLLIPVFAILFNAAYYWRVPTISHFIGSILVLGSAFAILYSGETSKTNASESRAEAL